MKADRNTFARRSEQELLQKLAPLGDVEGVRDYLFLNREGVILARKPDSAYDEKTAGALARHMTQAGEILRLLANHEGDERVFDFHFKGTLLVAWELGETYLVAQCREDANPAIVRMTVNVIKDELRRNKRLRGYLARRSHEGPVLGEQDVGSERYRHVMALMQE